MKITIALLILTAMVSAVFLTSCKKAGVQTDVEQAISEDRFQFIALLDNNGKWTYPQVPGIPDWYFRTTGIAIRQTKSETYDADSAYMKAYNDALYQSLQAQGKLHVIEENVAKVKANLDKYKAATQQSETNPVAQKN